MIEVNTESKKKYCTQLQELAKTSPALPTAQACNVIIWIAARYD